MLRLFANITAGHIVIIIFVSLIFIFGDAGQSLTGSITGIFVAVPLTMFMMSIELLVAFIQAFVFCILSASYISAAIEEPHHH
jgi:F-type H+-transporting ATPase subunit a